MNEWISENLIFCSHKIKKQTIFKLVHFDHFQTQTMFENIMNDKM